MLHVQNGTRIPFSQGELFPIPLVQDRERGERYTGNAIFAVSYGHAIVLEEG